jgi:hypothetical protein
MATASFAAGIRIPRDLATGRGMLRHARFGPSAMASIATSSGRRGSGSPRGYDADWIRALVSQHGAWANIPPKSNRKEAICFSPHLYRTRNLIERFFNKIKQCRRVATHYDKLAANYLAFIQLASIRLWLRVNESTA